MASTPRTIEAFAEFKFTCNELVVNYGKNEAKLTYVRLRDLNELNNPESDSIRVPSDELPYLIEELKLIEATTKDVVTLMDRRNKYPGGYLENDFVELWAKQSNAASRRAEDLLAAEELGLGLQRAASKPVIESAEDAIKHGARLRKAAELREARKAAKAKTATTTKRRSK